MIRGKLIFSGLLVAMVGFVGCAEDNEATALEGSSSAPPAAVPANDELTQQINQATSSEEAHQIFDQQGYETTPGR